MQRFLKNLPYLLCYICAFVLGMKQLREPDIWWQLLSGRWMLENGAITRTDMFSYTMAGHRWINVKWLYEILIGSIEKMSGPEGVVLLQCLVNVAIVYLLQRTLQYFAAQQRRELPMFPKVAAMLLFLAIVEYRMAGRPEMISHLMCALYMFLLWRSPAFEWKKIGWLVLLQCIWANMHEGYPVGIVTIGTYMGGSFISYIINKEKNYLQQGIRAAMVFGAAILVILLNPNGIQLWKQPFEIYRQVWANKYTTELYSYTNPEYWTIEAKWHIGLLIAVIAFWIVRIVENRKQKTLQFSPMLVSYLLLIPLMGYLSLTANRNIPFSQIVLFPTVSIMVMWVIEKLKLQTKGWYIKVAKQSAIAAGIIGLLFYVSIVSNRFYKYTQSPNRYGIHISMMHNPTGVADFIRQYNIKGLPFSDYFVSSYLLWSLYPDYKSYIDLRDLDVFPTEFFDDYFSMYNAPDKFFEVDKKYNFNYVVLSTSQMVPLQQKLYWGQEYNLVYIDPVACLYVKKNAGNAAISNDPVAQKLFTWPAPIDDATWASALTNLLNPAAAYDDEEETNLPVRAALFYNQVRNYPLAIKVLQPHLAELEGNADAFYAMGNTYLDYGNVLSDPRQKAQKIDSARLLLEQAIALDPGKPNVYSALASIYMVQGNTNEAERLLKKYIELDKHNDGVYMMLGLCERHDGNTSKMMQYMEESIRINDENGKAHLYMSEGYTNGSVKEKARMHLGKALNTNARWTEGETKLIQQLKAQLNMP